MALPRSERTGQTKSLTLERWQRVKMLFHAALDRAPEERPAFLACACPDLSLREEVASLLSAHREAGSFLEAPAVASVAPHSTDPSGHAGAAPGLAPGSRFGHYEILDRIGAGGMGEVYRARDTRLDRTVAIKFVGGVAADETSTAGVLREARAASQLNHPHICTIYEVGEASDRAYFAMEYVDGQPLNKLIPDSGLPIDAVTRLGGQVADALAHAHEHGVVHSDLKSANVVVTREGRVKVLDFGLARRLSSGAARAHGDQSLTRPGRIAGTPAYMAPELLRGAPADARSDVWALGVMLYEMTSGQLPFAGSSEFETIGAILDESPSLLPHHVPAELRAIIDRCLAKDPAERPESAGDVRLALEMMGAATPVTHRAWMARPVAGLLALVVAAAAAGLLYFYPRQQPPEQVAGSAPPRITMAVVPFRALAGADDIGFLSIGIPDAIISRLATIEQIRPRPTSAILPYEKGTIDPQAAGAALKVEYVLTGTIQQRGEQIRVSPQLVRVADGVALWARPYNLSPQDLLTLQDDIARRVADALQIQMTASERERVYRRYTRNARAYALYLEARGHLARNRGENARAAVDLFRQAVDLDPDYVLGRAGLAMASAQMRLFFAPESEVAMWEAQAQREARRVVEQAPTLAEAHEALAAVYRSAEFNWHGAIEESSKALEFNPNLDLPHLYRASAFSHLGLLDRVPAETTAATDINPAAAPEALRVEGITAVFAGEFGRAVSLLEEARRSSGRLAADWNLALAYHYVGRRPAAEEMLTSLRGSARSERRAQATLASFLAARGDRGGAEALLEAVTAGPYMDHHVAYSLGVAYAQLGNPSRAVDWLARAAATGFPCYPWYTRDPLLAPLKTLPGFQRLLDELRRSWESAATRHPSDQ